MAGVNYDHRRAWLISWLKFLSYVYAIDIPLVSRYGLDSDKWLKQVRNFDRCFSYCAGDSEAILDFAKIFNRKWAKGCGRRVA